MVSTFLRTLLAAGIMGAVVLSFTSLLPTLSPLLIIIVGGGLGLAIYLGMGILFGVKEIRLVPRLVGR